MEIFRTNAWNMAKITKLKKKIEKRKIAWQIFGGRTAKTDLPQVSHLVKHVEKAQIRIFQSSLARNYQLTQILCISDH